MSCDDELKVKLEIGLEQVIPQNWITEIQGVLVSPKKGGARDDDHESTVMELADDDEDEAEMACVKQIKFEDERRRARLLKLGFKIQSQQHQDRRKDAHKFCRVLAERGKKRTNGSRNLSKQYNKHIDSCAQVL